MKDLWVKIGCFLTGWNYKILSTCTEASRKQLKKYTSAILILIILWCVVGYSFAQRYMQTSTIGSIIIAFIFVIIIIQIERQIILNVGKNRRGTIFRYIIAIIMAILGSSILDQIIFKDDIEKKMIEIVDLQVKQQLPNRVSILNYKLTELQTDIDSLDKKNIELNNDINKRPTIITRSTSVTSIPMHNEDGSISNKNQRTVSTSPINNPKIKEVEVNQNLLEDLRVKQEEYTKLKINVENNLRKELGSKKGFLEELMAMKELLANNVIALIFYIILFAFLISLELFVVMSKSGENKCDYDLIMEHQLEQKKRTLNNLLNKKEVVNT